MATVGGIFAIAAMLFCVGACVSCILYATLTARDQARRVSPW